MRWWKASAVGLVALAAGCTAEDRSGNPGPPYTPIQQRYRSGTQPAAEELQPSRPGLDMPDWEDHPSSRVGEQAERTPPAPEVQQGTPTIPTPPQPYQEEGIVGPHPRGDVPYDLDLAGQPVGGYGGSGTGHQPLLERLRAPPLYQGTAPQRPVQPGE